MHFTAQQLIAVHGCPATLYISMQAGQPGVVKCTNH